MFCLLNLQMVTMWTPQLSGGPTDAMDLSLGPVAFPGWGHMALALPGGPVLWNLGAASKAPKPMHSGSSTGVAEPMISELLSGSFFHCVEKYSLASVDMIDPH